MKEIRITESNMKEALAQIDTLEGLRPKDRGCLRLLAEEMFSMCRELLHTDVMDFEIRQEEGQYTLRTITKAQVTETAREHFLSMSSSGKNAANQGIRGLMGIIMEVLAFEGRLALYESAWSYGLQTPGIDYASVWTLSQYIESAPKEEVNSEWDGMEKSIIANFADDVSIGIRSGKLEITVTKMF
ncbi:hypothetical protein FRZ06_06450 [Anoxybacterium hadale]|uniref:Uncharacterized protein n=1 Tax=Anoxybacterium hadale TaxID=3408580 RepID=A0ACD1A973_9FIRM|nr:hypothetical protein FRZ06_06450 [Clostridiales bacterium]